MGKIYQLILLRIAKYLLSASVIFFYSSLFAVDQTPTSSTGEALTKLHCAECHEQDGNSKQENIPKIAGFSAILIFDSLDQFKSGDRPTLKIKNKAKKVTNMREISKRLTEEQTEAIALYLSTQKFSVEKQTSNKRLAMLGKQLHQDLCNDCHAENGSSSEDDAPILMGQWKPYLQRQFKQLSEQKRYMTRRMKRKFKKLNEQDKAALIEFYSSGLRSP